MFFNGGQMILDDILPTWTVREVHEAHISASRDALWEAVTHLDFSASWLTRLLFGLRGLETMGLTLQDMVVSGPFRVFAEAPGSELVLGLVCDTKMVPVPMETVEDFQGYIEDGVSRIAWNFFIEEGGGGLCLRTETRVACMGPRSRRWFLPYWVLIRPFSGLIRREMLRLAAKQAKKAG